jgi:mono/diheme cytochrome c family protein
VSGIDSGGRYGENVTVRRIGLLAAAALLYGAAEGRVAFAEEIGAIYEARCAFCHGADGRGNGPAGVALKPPPTNFAAPDYWKNAQPEQIKNVIAKGKPGSAMVAFGDTMKPDEIAAMVEYLRKFSP